MIIPPSCPHCKWPVMREVGGWQCYICEFWMPYEYAMEINLKEFIYEP